MSCDFSCFLGFFFLVVCLRSPAETLSLHLLSASPRLQTKLPEYWTYVPAVSKTQIYVLHHFDLPYFDLPLTCPSSPWTGFSSSWEFLTWDPAWGLKISWMGTITYAQQLSCSTAVNLENPVSGLYAVIDSFQTLKFESKPMRPKSLAHEQGKTTLLLKSKVSCLAVWEY